MDVVCWCRLVVGVGLAALGLLTCGDHADSLDICVDECPAVAAGDPVNDIAVLKFGMVC